MHRNAHTLSECTLGPHPPPATNTLLRRTVLPLSIADMTRPRAACSICRPRWPAHSTLFTPMIAERTLAGSVDLHFICPPCLSASRVPAPLCSSLCRPCCLSCFVSSLLASVQSPAYAYYSLVSLVTLLQLGGENTGGAKWRAALTAGWAEQQLQQLQRFLLCSVATRPYHDSPGALCLGPSPGGWASARGPPGRDRGGAEAHARASSSMGGGREGVFWTPCPTDFLGRPAAFPLLDPCP